MYLIQVLIPVWHKNGVPVPPQDFALGGLTEFSRSPARGHWKPARNGDAEQDDIIVFEVMTDTLDRSWWSLLRQGLEARLGQEMIVIRSQAIELL